MDDEDWELDALLLTRCLDGDGDACKELYARHADAIIRFFRNSVRADELEDLAQDTLERLFAALPRIREGRSIRAFALKIARNVLLEHLRQLKRDRSFDPEVEAIAGLDHGPVSLVVGRNEMRLLLAGLRRIPLNDQLLLEQRYFEGRANVDLARAEGAPSSTIRNRMARARKLLEAEIAKLEGSGPLIASTIEHLDDWARDIRETLRQQDPKD